MTHAQLDKATLFGKFLKISVDVAFDIHSSVYVLKGYKILKFWQTISFDINIFSFNLREVYWIRDSGYGLCVAKQS